MIASEPGPTAMTDCSDDLAASGGVIELALLDCRDQFAALMSLAEGIGFRSRG
jgi:hypothetical protein